MIGLPTLSFADAKMDRANIVKGKIGIAIVTDEQSKLARKRNRITTQDKLKVYTLPEFKNSTEVVSFAKTIEPDTLLARNVAANKVIFIVSPSSSFY